MQLPLLSPHFNPMFVYNPFKYALPTKGLSDLTSCAKILDGGQSVLGLFEAQAKYFSGTQAFPGAANILPGQERSGLA